MGIRFSERGPDFPYDLVDDLLEGNVVFLCGAGVSTPQLPGFTELVDKVYAHIGATPSLGEDEARRAGRLEEVLGSLARRIVDPGQVHEAVRRKLQVEAPQLDNHTSLLRLARDLNNRISIVTTNFDTLFEHALENLSGRGSARACSFSGQTVPLPGAVDFGGIIHLHGRLQDEPLGLEPTPLVLTAAEYGEAYMRSGWASRFLFDLARCRTVVLVGYSANDAPVRYFLNVLEADRARFRDVKPVYALDGSDGPAVTDGDRWSLIAVKRLAYRKGEEGDRHAALWDDLKKLADLVETPKAWRRKQAADLLSQPIETVSRANLEIVNWLFKNRSDLFDVAVTKISDPRWFDHFSAQKLWDAVDSVWVLSAWCAAAWDDHARFGAAIAWHRTFGQAFGQAIEARLASRGPASPLFERAWRILASIEHKREDEGLEGFQLAGRLRSEGRLDVDLRAAVQLLSPRASVDDFATAQSASAREAAPRLLADLIAISLSAPAIDSVPEVCEALLSIPQSADRIIEIATEELRNAIALAYDVDHISPTWDRFDSGVPAVERHPQNQYRDGAVLLTQLLTDLLPHAAASDRQRARLWAATWRQLPSQLGYRLFLHACRLPELFAPDEVAEAILQLPHRAFWSIKRELLLAITDRLATANSDLVSAICSRIINEAPSLYCDLTPSQDERSDWRPQARDHDAWLRLSALKDAGVLPIPGDEALRAIAGRNPHLKSGIEDRDMFSSYLTSVYSLQPDPAVLSQAPAEQRLPLARKLKEKWDPRSERHWGAYCEVDPFGALETLKRGNLSAADGPLWSDLIGSLSFPLQTDTAETRTRRSAIVEALLDHLEHAPPPLLAQVGARLVELLPVARQTLPGLGDAWWDRLWTTVELASEPFQVESAERFYGQAINSPAGRLADQLLSVLNERKSRRLRIAAADRDRLRRIMASDTPAGWLGRGALVRDASFILHLDRTGSITLLRPALARRDHQGLSLRAVLVAFVRLDPKGSRVYKAELIQGARESQVSAEAATGVALSLLNPLFVRAMTAASASRGEICAADIRQALRQSSPSILEGAAQAMRLWGALSDRSPEDNWHQLVQPVFETAWPPERKFVFPEQTRALAAVCVGAGDAFPKAFETMRHHLMPMKGKYAGLHFLTTSEAAVHFPDVTLSLLWTVIGPGSSASFPDLGKILDRLALAAPTLITDRRFQWLEQKAVRYA